MTYSEMNAREKLEHIAYWLGMQEEYLSDGLKTPQDAIKLFDYMQRTKDISELADEWDEKDFKKAIGYNPYKNL